MGLKLVRIRTTSPLHSARQNESDCNEMANGVHRIKLMLRNTVFILHSHVSDAQFYADAG